MQRHTMLLILAIAISTTDCHTGACERSGFEVWDGKVLECCLPAPDSVAGDFGALPGHEAAAPLHSSGAHGLRFATAGRNACRRVELLHAVAEGIENCVKDLAPKTTATLRLRWRRAAAGFTLTTDVRALEPCVHHVALTVPPPFTFEGTCTIAVQHVVPAGAPR